MGDKGGEPKGGGSYEGKLAELTTGVGEMNLNDLDDDVHDDVHDYIDNSTTTYHRTDYYPQGGAGASKTPCRTPGAIGDVKGEPSEKTLMQAARNFNDRMTNHCMDAAGVSTPSDGFSRRRKLTKQTKEKLARQWESQSRNYDIEENGISSPSTRKLLPSELSQVKKEREAGGNSDDVDELARRMAAAKRASRGARKPLGSELGQPKVW